jgi:hypothetical protein
MQKVKSIVRRMFVKSRKCNGKPYDTVDTETWYAVCGLEAPHAPHTFNTQ